MERVIKKAKVNIKAQDILKYHLCLMELEDRTETGHALSYVNVEIALLVHSDTVPV